MTTIDYRQTPGVSRLSADYLYDYSKLARFYAGGDPYRLRGVEFAYPEELRRVMAGVLARQNRAWGAGAATQAMLDRFAQPGAVVIVAGQQVGLFGGALLTLHKAMTAVKLAARLRSEGVNAVPLFWMATQDHDWQEVNHVTIRDADANLVRLQLAGPPAVAASVGPLPLGPDVSAAVAELERCAGTSAAALSGFYRPDATLGDAFARTLAAWFADFGLVVFDPLQAPEIQSWLAPAYAEVLRRQDEWSGALQTRDTQLEAAGYHAQVKLAAGATLLFVEQGGARVALRRTGNRYQLGEQALSAAEAMGLIERAPERVSPSALLRPLIQDELFPTLAQVTGPAETAYLAQSAVLYDTLGRRQPVVYPRASATLVDAKARRLLGKYQVDVAQLWSEPAEPLLARRALPPGIERQAADIRAGFEREFTRLTTALTALDPTLIDPTQAAAQKIQHQLEQLETRVARSLARRNGELGRHARYLAATLFPSGHLQERELAAADAVLKLGPGLLPRLHDALALDAPDHQLIEV